MKHILITGGTQGLGAALTKQFPFAHVSAVSRRTGHDMSDKHTVHRLLGEVTAQFGPVDVLINNASSLGPLPMPLLSDLDCEDFEAVLQTNLLGPFRLAKAVLGHMVLQGEGLVVNISSDAAVAAYPHWGAYSVSKAALDQLTRVWAAELTGTGVRLVSIDPGEMDTQMHRDALPSADPHTLSNPDDVAKKIVTLLADAQSGARVIV